MADDQEVQRWATERSEATLRELAPGVLLFTVFFFGQQIYIRFDEEPALRARFGEHHERYYREVPRLIPRLSSSKSAKAP